MAVDRVGDFASPLCIGWLRRWRNCQITLKGGDNIDRALLFGHHILVLIVIVQVSASVRVFVSTQWAAFRFFFVFKGIKTERKNVCSRNFARIEL